MSAYFNPSLLNTNFYDSNHIFFTFVPLFLASFILYNYLELLLRFIRYSYLREKGKLNLSEKNLPNAPKWMAIDKKCNIFESKDFCPINSELQIINPRFKNAFTLSEDLFERLLMPVIWAVLITSLYGSSYLPLLFFISLIVDGFAAMFYSAAINIIDPIKENKEKIWNHIDYFTYLLIYTISISTITSCIIYVTEYLLKFGYYEVRLLVLFYLIIETYLILSGEAKERWYKSLWDTITPGLLLGTPFVLVYFGIRYRSLRILQEDGFSTLLSIPKYNIRNPSWLEFLSEVLRDKDSGKGGPKIDIKIKKINFPNIDLRETLKKCIIRFPWS
jgi:hypothetical protein